MENLSVEKNPDNKQLFLSSVQDIHFPPGEPQFLKSNLSNIGILGAPLMKLIIDYMDKIYVLSHVISHVINEENSVLPFSNNVPKLYNLNEVSQVLDYVVKLREDCELIQSKLLKNKRFHRVLGMVWDLEK